MPRLITILVLLRGSQCCHHRGRACGLLFGKRGQSRKVNTEVKHRGQSEISNTRVMCSRVLATCARHFDGWNKIQTVILVRSIAGQIHRSNIEVKSERLKRDIIHHCDIRLHVSARCRLLVSRLLMPDTKSKHWGQIWEKAQTTRVWQTAQDLPEYF